MYVVALNIVETVIFSRMFNQLQCVDIISWFTEGHLACISLLH